ncbi:hypothetical protein [Candidatus Palauibacter sp.]|uniref:hypothetical protein n=1 Tax=Candidatus Palauibacter sp. TaxID=3101350 RepID=UPI003CC52954
MRRVDNRPDLVGDGWDGEPLLTTRQVADRLAIPPKRVCELPLTRIRVFNRTFRYRPADLEAFIKQRTEGRAA